jgi:prepilin-type N-terminal cleavage/methylation domain-containing protein
MKIVPSGSARAHGGRPRSRRPARGFTLIELMVAMAVFLVVAGTAFSVFNKHMQMITRQENLSGVNLALRNAAGQLQMDLSKSGQNLLAGIGNSQVSFSAGVIINNNVPAAQGGTAANCAPSGTMYSYPVPSACYDSITLFGPHNVGCAATANGYPPVLVISDPGNSQESLSSSSIIWGSDPNNAANDAADAACFKNGDELLVIQLPSGGATLNCASGVASSFCLASVTLTKDAQVSGGKIQLQHNPTGGSGGPGGCPGASCTDPQGVIYNPNSTSGTNFNNELAAGFSNGAYIVDIGSTTSNVTYSVQINPQQANDPQLVRCDSNGCAVLADQVLGFKVGAALWNNDQGGQPDIANYFYDSSKYCNEINGANCNTVPPPVNDQYNFSLIRAVRVSLIGRTPPKSDATLNKFANGFDAGPYLIQQTSVVVDLRNLSIGDFQN